eukprot:jgi/Tetstr1/429232/TSEL_001895.t1
MQRSVVDNEPTYIRQRKQYESKQTGPREHVRMFLEHFFSDDLGHVEIMPFHDDGNNETFNKHLPPWMTKICVYYYYKSWAENDNAIFRDLATESEVKLASFDTFRRTWKKDFPDVTTPKIGHLERVRQERRDLNNAVFQSRLGHGNFFFFEIDSMDSAKTLLPHWARIPKTVKPDMLLKYHLTCVKYDGYRPGDIYYYTNTIPYDSSTTCTLTWITIMKIFSRIRLALSRSSAYTTIEAFLDLVANAFSPTPEIAELSFSLDFSEWLRPHFQDHTHDISKPHKFEFTRDDAAASGGSLRTALWSNTPPSEPVQTLKPNWDARDSDMLVAANKMAGVDKLHVLLYYCDPPTTGGILKRMPGSGDRYEEVITGVDLVWTETSGLSGGRSSTSITRIETPDVGAKSAVRSGGTVIRRDLGFVTEARRTAGGAASGTMDASGENGS